MPQRGDGNSGAKQNPMPTSTPGDPVGIQVDAHPERPRVSAPLDSDEAARLPCFDDRDPAVRTPREAIVTGSRCWRRRRRCRRCPRCRSRSRRWAPGGRAPASPRPTRHRRDVGRFIFIATPKAAIWAGVAAPVMICSIAQLACPAARCCRSVRRSDPAPGRSRLRGGRSRRGHVPIFPCREPPTRTRERDTRKPNTPQGELDNYKASYFFM